MMVKTKYIPIDRLEIDPMNVRPEPDVDPELIDSIRDEGLIHPLLARPWGDKYGVVVGSRRLVAAKAPEVGLKEIRCEVEDLDDRSARLKSFKENEKREPIPEWKKREIIEEEFDSVDKRFSRPNRVKKVADELNLSRRTVRRYLDVSENLDHTIISRLKEPSERSKSERKQLKKSLPEKLGTRPKGAEGFDLEKEEATGFPSLSKVSLEVAAKLAESDFFKGLQKKDLGKAHELASEAAAAGRQQAPSVIGDWKAEMGEAKRKREEIISLGRPPLKVMVTLGMRIVDALDEWSEGKKSIRNRADAVESAVRYFLIEKEYLK